MINKLNRKDIHITLTHEGLRILDELAKSMGMTRGAAIELLLRQGNKRAIENKEQRKEGRTYHAESYG